MVNWKKGNGYAATIPVNASFGGFAASQFALDMIEYALQNEVILVASSGNNHQRTHVYLAAYSGVMAVGATAGNPDHAHAGYSRRAL